MPALLPQSIKAELIERINHGESINVIARALKLGKSTVYYHYQRLRGRRYRVPHFEPCASENEGEICGVFAGDGSQYFHPESYSYEVNVHFGEHNIAYAEHVKQLFDHFFDKQFLLRREGSRDRRLRLCTKSKVIFHYFHNYLLYESTHKHDTVHLKTLKLPLNFKIGFLRGLLDTDGCISMDRRSGRQCAAYYTTSQKLAHQVGLLLSELGISVGTCVDSRQGYKPCYRTYVLARSIDTFLKTVRPFKS